MDDVARFIRQLPEEIRQAGGIPVRRVLLAVLALLCNIGFYLPSIPSSAPGAGVPGVDKLVHVVVFALTVWLVGRALAPLRRFPMGWVVLLAVVHTLVIEAVQGLGLADRTADAGDVLAGMIGAGIGLAAWFLERRLADRRMAAEEDARGQELQQSAEPARQR